MDPYYLSAKEVSTCLTDLQSMLQHRTDILNDPRGGNPDLFTNLGSKMSESVSTLHGLLRDIGAAIQQIRANPFQFRISDHELATREQFLSESLRQVETLETEMNNQATQQRNQIRISAFQPIATVPHAHHEAEPMNELRYEARQEAQIDELVETVRVEKHLGQAIVNALEEDRLMILDLDNGVDNAQTAMKKLTEQITQLIDNEGRVPTYLVAILSVVLIFMLWWVARRCLLTQEGGRMAECD
jgi:methyl-accepting chemotaxis protein